MRAAIETLVDISGGRTLAVLGDMLELGDMALGEHRSLGEFIFNKGIDYLSPMVNWLQKSVRVPMMQG